MITYWGLKTEFEEQKRMREVCQSILATLPEENLICVSGKETSITCIFR